MQQRANFSHAKAVSGSRIAQWQSPRNKIYGFLVTKLECFLSVIFRDFASHIKRPFELRYNPYTQSVEVLDNEELIALAVSEIKGDLTKICAALKRLK